MIRVLVIDDDPNVRFTVRVALEGAPPPDGDPMHIVEVSGAPQAFDALAAHQFDVVLLDVMMPGMDGFKILHRLRNGDHADIPVVMLTSRGRESDVANAFRAGADNYVTKPFEVDHLAEVVRHIATATGEERQLHRHQELERAELLMQLEHNFGDVPKRE